MYTVIGYDVSDDKRRYRVVRRLQDSCARVQWSLFETAELGPRQFLRLRSDLLGMIDPDTDSLRYHRLCKACAARMVADGRVLAVVEPHLPFVIVD